VGCSRLTRASWTSRNRMGTSGWHQGSPLSTISVLPASGTSLKPSMVTAKSTHNRTTSLPTNTSLKMSTLLRWRCIHLLARVNPSLPSITKGKTSLTSGWLRSLPTRKVTSRTKSLTRMSHRAPSPTTTLQKKWKGAPFLARRIWRSRKLWSRNLSTLRWWTQAKESR